MRRACCESIEPRRHLSAALSRPSFAPIRINAGGGAIVDSYARRFLADQRFTGGVIGSAVDAFPGDLASQTYRAGATFSFSHKLPRGSYTVVATVADPTSLLAGQRVMDVFAEGTLAIDDFDARNTYRPNPAQGDDLHSVSMAALVKVTDGELNLNFVGVVGEALVSSISIYPNEAPANIQPYEQITLNEATINTIDSARLRELGLHLMLFSNENRNRYPWSWTEVAESQYLSQAGVASAWRVNSAPRGLLVEDEIGAFAAARGDFILLTRGRNNATPAEAALAYRTLDLPGAMIPVLRGDGHVELVARDALRSELGLAPESIDTDLGQRVPAATDSLALSTRSRLNDLNRGIALYRNTHSNRDPARLSELFRTGHITDVSTFLHPRSPVTIPAGLSKDEMAAWIDQNAGFHFNELRGTNRHRPHLIHLSESPRNARGPVWMVTTNAGAMLYEPMWANELLRRTQAVLNPASVPQLIQESDNVQRATRRDGEAERALSLI